MRHAIELTGELELTEEQQDAVDAHSLTNVVAVLGALLQSLQLYEPDDAEIGATVASVRRIGRISRSMRRLVDNHADVYQLADKIDDVTAVIARCDDAELPHDAERLERRHLAETTRQVAEIMRVRLVELQARSAVGDDWLPHQVAILRDKLQAVLRAMARASRGRYAVEFEPGQPSSKTYQVLLDFRPVSGSAITMPAVIQDVLRDLLANSRKYTDPGGRLSAHLIETPEAIELEVSDDGRGIPANELRRVVDFGYRAANATGRSCGGGYGLTKAYWVVRRLVGRMWLESEVGRGTTVRCKIPRPYCLQSDG